MEATVSTKILLYNIGYCTGLDGSLHDYFLHFLRYLYTPKRVWNKVISSIDQLVQSEEPDICCFVEVRQVKKFIRGLWEYPFHDFENKYGLRSILRFLPWFRKNCSGLFARKHMEVRKYFLQHGTKKLLYELKLNHDTSLLMSHFSLWRKTRKKQFEELKWLIAQRKRVILCGDFNTFGGCEELGELIRDCHLRMVNTLHDATFPASHPKRALDLFLCSEEMPIQRLRVLTQERESDHLPVVLEVVL